MSATPNINLLKIKGNKFDATAAPTATDDSTAGYGVGSVWIDTTNNFVYTCVDATTSNAVWALNGGSSTGTKVLVTGGFSGSGTYQTLANSTNNLLEFDDSVTGGTDVNGEWDNTAHRFTVNASGAGTYLFQASLFVESASAWGTIYLKKNGTQLTTQTLGSSSHNVGFDGVSGSVAVDLAVGDYIEYYADWRNATGAIKDTWGADKQTFSISKIGDSTTVNNVTLPSLTKTIVLEAPADAEAELADADVEKTFREFLANFFEFVALAHRCRHHGDPFVPSHAVANRHTGGVGIATHG